MLEDGAITEAEARAAENGPLETHGRDATETVTADYFAEEVRREIKQVYGDAALYQGGLSVRTSVDPRLQRIATRALHNGLIAYDRRHGWRGPVTTMANFDNWPETLAAVERPAGAGAWELAVVLEVDADDAVIGFTDRSRGVIPMAEMTWAAPQRPEQRVGPKPDSADDVLALGDVVLVEPLAEDRKSTRLKSSH